MIRPPGEVRTPEDPSLSQKHAKKIHSSTTPSKRGAKSNQLRHCVKPSPFAPYAYIARGVPTLCVFILGALRSFSDSPGEENGGAHRLLLLFLYSPLYRAIFLFIFECPPSPPGVSVFLLFTTWPPSTKSPFFPSQKLAANLRCTPPPVAVERRKTVLLDLILNHDTRNHAGRYCCTAHAQSRYRAH